MLQEPSTSPYDFHFQLLGFRVRVAWGFWVAALVLGWSWSQNMDFAAQQANLASPGAPVLLVIWVAAVFLSILVHELGHSLAFRYFGTDSHIVLYHFGGLAIPSSFGSWDGARRRRIESRDQIIISAAGPALQLTLAGLAMLACYLLKIPFSIPFLGNVYAPPLEVSFALLALMDAILLPSIFWALLNLAPILPLDGGQIMRGALMMSRVQDPARTSFAVSAFAGVAIGILFLMNGQPIAGIMFMFFAVNNWQAMQYGGGPF